jgi:pimeloyl-ACP methyl ester carboxylesterase
MALARALKKALLALAIALLAATAGLTLAGVTYRPDDSIPEGLEGKHVTVMGNPLRVLQKGSGPDVLLVHGSPGTLEDWAPVTAALAATHRVTVYDRPGQGWSGDEGDLHTYGYHAEVAHALIAALGLRDVVVAGHSYGGGTALALAVRRPPEVKAIVVVDAAAYRWLRAPDPLYRIVAIPGLGTGVARVLGRRLGPPKVRAGLLAQFRGPPPPEEFLAFRARVWTEPKVLRSIAHEVLLADPSLASISPRYPEIAVPTFVLAQKDDPGRREAAERLAREVPGARLTLLEGAGHYLQLEKTAEVVAAIEEASRVAPAAPR